MLDKLMWLDDYDRNARLVPGLLLISPIVISLVGFGVRDNPVVAVICGVLVSFGAPVLLAKHVRRRGKRLERQLYTTWGGRPTTILLRPEQDGSIGPLKQQRRQQLERISGVKLPASSATSATDDESYETAMATLLAKTADHASFNKVYVELKNYGFERNLRGVRRDGITASFAAAAALALGVLASMLDWIDLPLTPLFMATAVVFPVGLFWIFWPTEERVREAADTYAQRILDEAVNLPTLGDR